MHTWGKILVLIGCLAQIGCGVVVGTVIDTAVGAAAYPFKEYIFCQAYKYDNTWEEPYHKVEHNRDHGELLLGVAVSGGGSRSAYFCAAVLEQLGKIPIHEGSDKTYLDEMDYISGVSGGSLASAYYCLKRPEYKDDKKFFRDYKEAMQSNFELRALLRIAFYGHQFLNVFTYHDRGDTMASVWDSDFFAGATFADVAKAEKKGAPILIINGTNLNDGLKFVFTTLADDYFNESLFFHQVRDAGFIVDFSDSSHTPFKTVGFQSLQNDIRSYPVSKAVVASASVPNLLGPVTLKDHSQEDRLIHISDGGIYDNYGVESLMQVFTKKLEKNPNLRTRIIVIDGSGYFEEEKEHSDDFSVAYYADRPLSISWLRTKGYMEYAFQKAKKNHPYLKLDFRVLSLYDTQLPSQKSKDPLVKDKALQSILSPHTTTIDFLKSVTTIQTRFSLSGEDTAVIEEVAKRVCKLRLQSTEE